MRVFHVTPLENLPDILREGLMPRIGERSRACAELEPAIFCFPDLETLEGAGWLADAFEDEQALCIIEMQIPDEARRLNGAGYEIVLAERVPASAIRTVFDEEMVPIAPALLADQVRNDLIEVDGVWRPMKNSAGMPIHPTREGVENFWRWFGDSKTVDESGRPLVLYHGTEERFDSFCIDDDADGAFFTTNRDAAEDYGQHVVSGYLKIARPLEIDSNDWALGNCASRAEAEDQGLDGYIVRDHDISGAEGEDTIHSAVGDTYVVFNPAQVKSAVGNSGLFDPDSPLLTDPLPLCDLSSEGPSRRSAFAADAMPGERMTCSL